MILITKIPNFKKNSQCIKYLTIFKMKLWVLRIKWSVSMLRIKLIRNMLTDHLICKLCFSTLRIKWSVSMLRIKWSVSMLRIKLIRNMLMDQVIRKTHSNFQIAFYAIAGNNGGKRTGSQCLPRRWTVTKLPRRGRWRCSSRKPPQCTMTTS